MEKEKKIENELPPLDGSIFIGFNSKSGDFEVYTEVSDLSDASVETLTLILLLFAQGKMNGYIYDSLNAWAEGDEDRKIFNEAISEKYKQYQSILDSFDKIIENDNIIKPSEVFNLKGLK